MEIKVTSRAFPDGGDIPKQYTCDGADVSPPLAWSAAPEATKSFAVVVNDPDAPMGNWLHWIIYDIPAHVRALDERTPPAKVLPNGEKQGTNDFGRIGYGGPCPPSGTHRYIFKVYALDVMPDLPPGARKPQLLKAMQGHILAEGELMGKYARG